MLNTCARFAGTHGGVLNQHTVFFRVPSRATHTTHTTTRHTTQHTDHTINNDTAQHTTTPKHKTHIPHTLSAHTPPHTPTQHQHTTHQTPPRTKYTHHAARTHHHQTHTRMLGHVHGGQPTVILSFNVNAWICAQRATDRDLESFVNAWICTLLFLVSGQFFRSFPLEFSVTQAIAGTARGGPLHMHASFLVSSDPY